MRWLLMAGLMVALIVAACDDLFQQREIEIEPGEPPEEIRGATWESFPLTYCVYRDDQLALVPHEDFVRLVDEAFRQWGLPSENEGDCPEEPEMGNGRNEIYWGHISEAEGGGMAHAGQTVLSYRRLGSADTEIVESNIIIDAGLPPHLRSEDCLLTVLLHEVGHFLGLYHLPSPAVMAPVITDCPGELTEYDYEALEELY